MLEMQARDHDEVQLQRIDSDYGDNRTPEARAARRRVWLRAMAGELICTFLFFFSVMSANINFSRQVTPATAYSPVALIIANALSSGMTAIGIVYSFADVSGAHFNPAVSFATWLARKTSNRKSVSFVGMQLIASVLSVLACMAVFPGGVDIAKQLVVETPEGVSLFRVFLMEFLLTFTFILIIFMTVFEHIEQRNRGVAQYKGFANARGLTLYTTNPQSKTGFAPLAIGFAIGFLSFIGGSISGGIFNPARLFGPALITWRWHNQWVYWLGELGGAACAALMSGLFVSLGSDKPRVSTTPSSDRNATSQLSEPLLEDEATL